MRLKNGVDLTIARARKQDAAGMIEYLNLVGGESDNLLFGANGFPLGVEEEERTIERMDASGTSALFVGTIGGEIVCVGSLQSSTRARIAHHADAALSVKKAYWGLGIGTELMRAMIASARSNGTTEIIHLGVRSDNTRAIRLYEKLGFVRIGLFRRFFKIDGAYHDEILMNLDL